MLQTPDPIVPFWNRLRDISLYATRGDALMTIGLLAICRLFTLLPGVGWVVGLAIWVGVYKYGFEVLRASANGRLEPPVGSMNVDEELGWSALRLQAGFVALNILCYVFLGPVVGIAASVLLAFGFPGAIMSLAIDENVLHALNPLTWLQVMGRLGWPYFIAALLCLVINASMSNVQGMLLPFLPFFIALPLFYLLAHYAVITTFHLMGYLMYQYHAELGYTVEVPLKLRTIADDPDQDLIDQSAALVRDGKPEAATELLAEQLHSRGGSDGVHVQYRKLLRLANDRGRLLQHGRQYLSVLLAQDKDKQAVSLAGECLGLDPAFAPAQPEEITRIAHKAAQLGQPQLVLGLLSGFHKRFPKSRDIPQNYLLVAKLLNERMGKDAEALALLQQLKKTFPDHELIPEIDQRAALIERMLKTAPAPA
jgi:tetratricopeptide (TPR) repeat protein